MTNLKLYAAMAQVQQKAPFIDKDATNPHFKSKYADLPAIWRGIKEIVGEAGLLVNHSMDCIDGNDYITTKIIHVESGEHIESRSRIMLSKSTAQEYGSYITYMRRYALTAMLGIVTDDDDDGNAASNAQSKAAAKPAAKPEPKQGNPLKLIADKIGQQLRASQTIEVLNYVWKGFGDDLAKIREESPNAAYPALEKIYQDMTVKLVESPIETDNIPY